MLRHQFGQNLIFGLDLFLQIFDALLLGLMVSSAFLLEGGRAVFKELLLPSIEDRRLQTQFLAQVRHRHVLHQTPPQNGDFLFCRVMLPLLLHAFSPLS
jgi:hypothetical protein